MFDGPDEGTISSMNRLATGASTKELMSRMGHVSPEAALRIPTRNRGQGRGHRGRYSTSSWPKHVRRRTSRCHRQLEPDRAGWCSETGRTRRPGTSVTAAGGAVGLSAQKGHLALSHSGCYRPGARTQSPVAVVQGWTHRGNRRGSSKINEICPGDGCDREWLLIYNPQRGVSGLPAPRMTAPIE